MVLDLRQGFGDFHNYKLTKFPDNSIKFELKTNAVITKVVVTLRTNDDILGLALIKDVINRTQPYAPELYITYMMYQQDDRLFKDVESFGLKVISGIINNMKWGRISIFHPHSDKVEFIDNVNIISNSTFVRQALDSIKVRGEDPEPYWIIPDAGAFKTQFKQINGSGHKNFITCLKSRDHSTGEIETIVPVEDLQGKPCFIVDDICLGGRTFTNIANELRKKNAGKLYLVVSHGVFNNGIGHLMQQFETIYTTNSITTLEENEYVRVFKL